MKNTYFDLVDQTFYFPQEGFDLKDNKLTFHGIDLHKLIKKYGTPLKLTYLPKIGEQIEKARGWFNQAIEETGYQGKYQYCYCTKSSHFRYVLDEVLAHNAQLETSSEFDIDLVRRLYANKKVTKETTIVNNGYKTAGYVEKISELINEGFKNILPVLDNTDELDFFAEHVKKKGQGVGIRVATEEEPNFEFYTSRLGIRPSEIIPFYKEKLAKNPKFKLKLLHFFVDTGVKDTIYYWSELKKALKMYCSIKKICPSLEILNVGGGLPIRNSLNKDFDYAYMIKEIVTLIKDTCEEEGVPEPHIFTEFGKFTVGESAATIFSVIGQKRQNDAELWYMVDNSLMTTIPDAWGISERFVLLPINHWNKEPHRVNVGGITCDNADYYNSEAHANMVFLPKFEVPKDEPLYIGFFHTGAYQDSLSGYGGIKHCLIPAPKRLLIDVNKKGEMTEKLYAEEQTAESMLSILGY
jgi:arginine decarboxylase